VREKKKETEYEKFHRTMQQLIRVPHSQVKAALDAEKADKNEKRKAKKPSSSGLAFREKD